MLKEGMGMVEDERGCKFSKSKIEGKEIEELVNVVLMLVACAQVVIMWEDSSL
jgi:hypothetical protein